MSRYKPTARTLKLLQLIERNPRGLRVQEMAEQINAPPRAIYRDIQVLEALGIPVYPDKSSRESFWKIDPDYRNRLSIPFTLTELLSLYLSQDSIRPLEGTIFYDSLESLFDKVRASLPNLFSDRWLICVAASSQGFLPRKTIGFIVSSLR